MVSDDKGEMASLVISRCERPIKGTEIPMTGRSGIPAARAVSIAMASKGPLTIRTVGIPSRSTSMRSRTLREVHVAQSPTATTSAA